MAMMEPISGLSQFLSVLTELRFGERSAYPLYCALLYTVAEGVDADLGRYVDVNWDELDAMTADRCLVFVVGDVRDEPAAGHRPFTPGEVYKIAEHLGIKVSSLPCAVFFAVPETSNEVLGLRLADYIGETGAGWSSHTLTRVFRGIATAIEHCSDLPEDSRLACLREQLVTEHERIFGSSQPTVGDRAQAAGQAAESVSKVVALGTTVAVAVGRAFGIPT